MTGKDIKCAKECIFNIVCEEPLVKNETYDFQLTAGSLMLRVADDKFTQVEILDSNKSELISELNEFSGRSLLRVDKATDGSTKYVVNLLKFYQHISFDETYQIVIDDAIYPELRKRNIESKDAVKYFSDEIIYKGKYWFGIGNNRNSQQQKLFGKKISIIVEPSAQNYLHIIEIRNNRRNESAENLVSLMSGSIAFKNSTDDIDKITREFLDKYNDATKDNAELIDLWRIYDELDQEAIKKEAEEMGFIKYKKYKRNNGNLIFSVEGGYVSSDFLRSDMQYVVIPEEFFNSEDPLGYDFKVATVLGSEYDKSCVNTTEFIISEDTMDSFRKIPERGYVLPSISGSIVQSKRRSIARKKILNGESPLIGLNLLLQTGDIVGVVGKQHPAITDDLRKYCFDGDKTKDFNDRQKEAIRVAVNTPDIAVIQGPPGTGKTKVIKAIVQRINELEDGKARILIASTQHDAVDNAIDGVSYGGVPVNRVLTRQKSFTQDTPLFKWIDDMIVSCGDWLEKNSTPNPYFEINGCLAKLKNTDGAFIVDELKRLYNALQKEGFSASVLSKTNEVIVGVIDFSDEVEVNNNGSRLSYLLAEQAESVNSFISDGKEKFKELEFYLKLECEEVTFDIPSYWKQLKRANEATSEVVEAFELFLTDIQKLKESLSPAKDSSSHFDYEELNKLIEMIEAEIAERGEDTTKEQKLFSSIWEFKHELSNAENVKKLIAQYSQVNAATCQQAANPKISPAMRGFEDKYDYVIIDEAARSNPLDLLIPMCMGKKVILVGDHKQLPHMVESDVVNAVIDKTKDESVKQVLEESLFMRLFHKVREADEEANKKNNIKISRTCTLNEQFRMHSAICDLINVFYKEEQLRPACEQGKERDFDLKKQHNLNLYNNKPLVWIDVPITEKTPAEKGGISKSRPCEVSVVKKELAKILSANTDYDIGIITFYSKQAQLIKEMIDDEFPSETHRISVGTVDAFQGKEFDVVILSAVRSNMETDSKKRVGFLNNNNRLCVAFSRAKRLLVTVGDSNTVAGNEDVTYVEPLKELFERSKQEDIGYYEII